MAWRCKHHGVIARPSGRGGFADIARKALFFLIQIISIVLKVIGAGVGRTGTTSLKRALEQLGFDKCYHMEELFKDQQRVVYWEQFHQGDFSNHAALFEGYQAAVDFPPSLYYKELMRLYPDAKIILTVRNPTSWFESCTNTIFRRPPAAVLAVVKLLGLFSPQKRIMSRVFAYIKSSAFDGFFQNKMHDKEFTINVFNEWNEEVKRHVPADRLLVFEAKDGWEPLCKFLNVPVPKVPYPRANDTAEFQSKHGISRFFK